MLIGLLQRRVSDVASCRWRTVWKILKPIGSKDCCLQKCPADQWPIRSKEKITKYTPINTTLFRIYQKKILKPAPDSQLGLNVSLYVNKGPVPLKGVWHEIFYFRFFFMNQRPPGLQVFHWGRFQFFRKFAEIFTNEYRRCRWHRR